MTKHLGGKGGGALGLFQRMGSGRTAQENSTPAGAPSMKARPRMLTAYMASADVEPFMVLIHREVKWVQTVRTATNRQMAGSSGMRLEIQMVLS
jgi:hypothetical protein